MKVLELFSGIGAPRKALERLGIEFETVDSVEIDKYAVKSYNAIYGTNFEYVPELQFKNAYFIMWGAMILVAAIMLYFFKKHKWF